ncbi:uncharacterized protein [Temnothorax longispinosus]|uniref:uncharacterized protein n=1 Tax=Temnothorax longispinosus TaxID=300112 RepID=UPI003A994C2C
MAESMIELHLQSSEGENVIVFVTAEDAARVVNDPKFAKRVANAALRRTHDTFQTQVVSDNISEDEERQEDEETGEMMNQPKKVERSGTQQQLYCCCTNIVRKKVFLSLGRGPTDFTGKKLPK